MWPTQVQSTINQLMILGPNRLTHVNSGTHYCDKLDMQKELCQIWKRCRDQYQRGTANLVAQHVRSLCPGSLCGRNGSARQWANHTSNQWTNQIPHRRTNHTSHEWTNQPSDVTADQVADDRLRGFSSADELSKLLQTWNENTQFQNSYLCRSKRLSNWLSILAFSQNWETLEILVIFFVNS